MNEYYLGAKYDGKKSFSKKARGREQNGVKTLKSCGTNLVCVDRGKACVFGTYSQTTIRHIKEFLKQQGFKVESTAQIVKDYPSEPQKKEVPNPYANVLLAIEFGKVSYGEDEEGRYKYNKKILLTIPGSFFPDDFDSLPLEERKKRIDGAINALQKSF